MKGFRFSISTFMFILLCPIQGQVGWLLLSFYLLGANSFNKTIQTIITSNILVLCTLLCFIVSFFQSLNLFRIIQSCKLVVATMLAQKQAQTDKEWYYELEYRFKDVSGESKVFFCRRYIPGCLGNSPTKQNLLINHNETKGIFQNDLPQGITLQELKDGSLAFNFVIKRLSILPVCTFLQIIPHLISFNPGATSSFLNPLLWEIIAWGSALWFFFYGTSYTISGCC